MLFLQNYFGRDSKFQFGRYILPVLSFYLLPVLLFYLNLLPIPTPRIPHQPNLVKQTSETKNDVLTYCGPRGIENVSAKSQNCTSDGKCSLSNEKIISCPPSLKYCCEYSRNGKTWTECCIALTYGIQQHTTSNITFIYVLILSTIISLLCCPCSPLFRNVRQNVIQKVCRSAKK